MADYFEESEQHQQDQEYAFQNYQQQEEQQNYAVIQLEDQQNNNQKEYQGDMFDVFQNEQHNNQFVMEESNPKVGKRRAEYEMRQKQLEQQVSDKIRQEQVRKQEIRNIAVQELQEWTNKHQHNLVTKRQQNRQKQQDILQQQQLSKKQEDWQTIKDNICMKETEYPGTKDVKRMREAIQNKIQDTTNN